MNIDREQFTEWLRDKEYDEIVGVTRDSGYCPTAEYLTKMGEIQVSVTVDKTTTFDTRSISVSNPCWLRDFILATDRLGRNGTEVKAWQALSILRRIPK